MAEIELVVDPWGSYLQERQAHQATLDLLARYEERGAILNGNGTVMQGRCRLCSEARRGSGVEYRNSCPCQTAAAHVAAEQARLAKDPRRGRKVSEGLFTPSQSSSESKTA